MIHRMALRVLPSLSQAVTTAEIRKRKRVVMLVSGLVAFVLYRLAQIMPLSDIGVVLTLSGSISTMIALIAYVLGRRLSFRAVSREDGIRVLSWIGAWIGFTYGVQLSLMVLALLKVFIQYDFLRHPDGPAMMAIIIACTSVARDAFELGHVRRLQLAVQPILTFPDGGALRAFVGSQMPRLVWPVAVATGLTIFVALLAAALGPFGSSELGQLFVVTAVVGTLALAAYLVGKHPELPWRPILNRLAWADVFRFWWWPGLAFAATYYLTLQGLLIFVFGANLQHVAIQAGLAGAVAASMWLYCQYLGERRAIEDRVSQRVPATLLRCPFVLGLLSKGDAAAAATPTPERIMLGEGRRG